MKFKITLFAAATAGMFWLAACQPDPVSNALNLRPNLPDQPYAYSNLQLPAGMNGGIPGIIIDFLPFPFINSANPAVTDRGATLGRVLFYDPQLSVNNRIACASCHKQELAFSDDVAGSVGFGGKVTPRNSMAIVNPVLNRNLFWDSRSGSVMDLSLRPVQNHIEMGMEDLNILAKKLAAIDYYPQLFQDAYGSPEITSERIAQAMTEFVCAITTANSRFDQQSNNGFAGFTPLEKMGMDLFNSPRTNCNRCHATGNFAAPDFPGGEYGVDPFSGSGNDLKGTANNGLDMVYADPGLGNGKFRIPSLRNIALTAPYMHDGRFKTLEEVIDFYNEGIKAHPNLDKNLKGADGKPLRPNLNGLEKEALLAFLHTLTDQSLLTDPKYSNPFK
jgi:cytochrome c peroxidase